MLEYFAIKKLKQRRAEKQANEEAESASSGSSSKEHNRHTRDQYDLTPPAHESSHGQGAAPTRRADPVLDPSEEAFLERILEADDDEERPPLPPRTPSVSEPDWLSESDSTLSAKGKGKAVERPKADKKAGRLSFLFNRYGGSSNNNKKAEEGLRPAADVPEGEGEREARDLGRVLDRLSLSAQNNKVVAASGDTSEALQRFTQVFKDLVNGVPTAYDDLVGLFQDRDTAMAKGFDKLPKSLQKLVTQLPEKLTASLGPEIMAAAAKSQGIDAAGAGVKGTLEKMILPQNIIELVTKPGALVAMLRAIVETLKARWPAFIGMNVIWSVALTLLMLMLWYCYKRGREVRLEREKTESAIDGSDRIEELPDDPLLPAPNPDTSRST
ncbi:hypothetical protein B0I35DRAFT_472754 [Stachybotrys elegans]|uniref:Ring-like domain-containing protein n=1 Tax=Stachybotrys elegans TaxID=80388 RepID=A0A8K0T0V2_9HYPO|nr:hypothetical protein B0I35DRAFT_472754 [Stachybotrys elegans]